MEQVEQGLLAVEARLRRDGAAAGAAKPPRASQVKSPGPQAQAPPAPQALQAAAAGADVAEGALIPCAGSQTQNVTGPAAAAAPQAHASDYA